MKILILRFSSIGDIVLTTPVIRCLKTQLKDATVHYATKQQYLSLLTKNPYLDKIHALGDDAAAFLKELNAEKFDLIIDLHHNLRTFLIWAQLRKRRYVFDKINMEKWMMTFLKIDILPYVHIVDRYMATLEPLKITNDGKGLDFFIDRSENLNAFELPTSFVVYAIGGQHATKKLPLKKQIELLRQIDDKVVLIGGKEDMEAGSLLSSECKHAINLCGQLSIHQSAMIVEKASKVFTHDSGMMHIAAALNKSIVSIWGNTIPRFGMTPYYAENILNSTFDELPQNPKSKIIEIKNLSCRPCSKIGYNKCPRGHFKCMLEIDFDAEFKQ